MANLVWNTLIVVKDNDNIGMEILYQLKEHGMNYFVPMAEYLLNEKLNNMLSTEPTWMDWAYTNWGTKWDIYNEDRVLRGNNLEFITANGPVEPFVDWLRVNYPTIVWQLDYTIEFDGSWTY